MADRKKGTSKESNQLIHVDEADEIISNVVKYKGNSNQDRYFLYRMLGMPPQIAAKLCDYHPDYGYKLDRKLRENQNLRARIAQITGQIPEQYGELCKLRLLSMAEIEGAALETYRDNPKLAIDKPQLLKQIKQAAGVLDHDDNQSRPLTVNIKEVQNLMVKANKFSRC
jgi:hypothetical protein